LLCYNYKAVRGEKRVVCGEAGLKSWPLRLVLLPGQQPLTKQNLRGTPISLLDGTQKVSPIHADWDEYYLIKWCLP